MYKNKNNIYTKNLRHLLQLISLLFLVCAMSIAKATNDESMVYDTLYRSAMTETIKESRNVEAQRLYKEAQAYYQKSIQLSAEKHHQIKKELLQQALTTMIGANSLVEQSNYSSSAKIVNSKSYQEIQFRQKEKAVRSLIAAHHSIRTEKHLGSDDDNIVVQVNSLIDYANDYLDNQNFKEASVVLEQGYKLIITSVSALRSGETLVFELNFSTPKDEYDYYIAKVSDALNAFETLAQRSMNSPKNPLLSKIQHKISTLVEQAKPLAQQGQYLAAVEIMEDAFGQMQSGLFVALR